MDDKLLEVFNLGHGLMQSHGLIGKGWQFDISNTKHRVGDCLHDKKIIRLSGNYITKTPMHELKDTILHEIAHALVGSGHGHDYTWQIKCMEIGARPQRLADESAQTTATHNYEIVCTACGKKWERYRLRRNLMREGAKSSCCHAKLKFYKVVKD